MTDPYSVLGLAQDASSESIRQRYLELIRTHTPERDPEKFASIRAAYDQLRDPIARLARRLLMMDDNDSIGALMADARSAVDLRRPTVEELLALGRKHV